MTSVVKKLRKPGAKMMERITRDAPGIREAKPLCNFVENGGSPYRVPPPCSERPTVTSSDFESDRRPRARQPTLGACGAQRHLATG